MIGRLASRRTLLVGAVAITIAAGATLGLVVASGRSSDGAPPVASALPVHFSALTKGRPLRPASVPITVMQFVDHAAMAVGLQPSTAQTRVHLVRAGMGGAKLAMYAFLGKRGRPCFYVPTFGGICVTVPRPRPVGFYWLVGANAGPGPAYLVALTSDDVRAVSLDVAGQHIPVSVGTNVAFAEYPKSSARTARVTVGYVGGGASSATIALH